MDQKDFVFIGRPARVIFGNGSLRHLEREVDLVGARRALVLCTPTRRDEGERVAALLGARCAGLFDAAAMHVPIEAARAAREMAARLGADCAVAIGGGSTIGLGKAIALESPLPIVAIPTTYAGSEMTTIFGITEAGVKKTGRDERVLPRTVIYDPQLTLGLPARVSVTSGMNAIAHAAEGFYSVNTNPVIDLMAQEGIAAFARALPVIAHTAPGTGGEHGEALLQARRDALYGAWLCGTVLASVDMALHHKLCHTIGGSFNLPHAETHTVILPHALAYNAPAAPGAMALTAKALGGRASAARAAFDLARDNGAPVSLRELGFQAGDLDRACDQAMQNQYPNPRPLERAALRQLLQDAFEGRRPD
ncbi:maleylacetate reductase [Ramlibacter sp. MAHUQ-53]|uniref:maleylacetate reductase n=1 Tax=unclassified Ramlibacter TaxID=2617605 RepID=UPI00363E7EB9